MAVRNDSDSGSIDAATEYDTVLRLYPGPFRNEDSEEPSDPTSRTEPVWLTASVTVHDPERDTAYVTAFDEYCQEEAETVIEDAIDNGYVKDVECLVSRCVEDSRYEQAESYLELLAEAGDLEFIDALYTDLNFKRGLNGVASFRNSLQGILEEHGREI